MTTLVIQHNGQEVTTPSLPNSFTFSTLREQATSQWPELSNATVLVNGTPVTSLDTSVGIVASGSRITFRLPTGTKA